MGCVLRLRCWKRGRWWTSDAPLAEFKYNEDIDIYALIQSSVEVLYSLFSLLLLFFFNERIEGRFVVCHVVFLLY